jgi:hypothetical protein
LTELADAYDAELLARPFTGITIIHGVVPEFLRAIGLDPSRFRNTNVRRNQDIGPFTVSVARRVSRSISAAGKQLKWLQAVRCTTKLGTYLEENKLADAGYCGLTTALARHIERGSRPDNDAFAQRIWGRPWADIFAADIGREFTPNDFAICKPEESTERRLWRAVREMTPIVEEIMLDPALAVEAPWNDLQRRGGCTPEGRSKNLAAEVSRAM